MTQTSPVGACSACSGPRKGLCVRARSAFYHLGLLRACKAAACCLMLSRCAGTSVLRRDEAYISK